MKNKRHSISFIKALIVLSFATWVPNIAGAQGPDLCSPFFSSQIETAPISSKDAELAIQKLQNRYGAAIEVLETPGNNGKVSFEVVEKYSREKVGEMDYRFHPAEKKLDIVWIEANVKEIGLSESLLTLALSRHPEAEIISTRALLDTNEKKVHEYLSKGLTIEQALKETPAYKIRKKLGFDEIILESINPDFGFETRRSK